MKPVLMLLWCIGIPLGLILAMQPTVFGGVFGGTKKEKAPGLHVTMNSMVYEKDTRTGLCFAYIPPRGMDGSPSISNVPCDKVENLLQK